MKSGYKIVWTSHALSELTQTLQYIHQHFSDREIKKLAQKIENTTELIAQNPKLFPLSEKKNVCRAVIMRYNTLYYRIKQNHIEILSFFSNRQNPKKRKM